MAVPYYIKRMVPAVILAIYSTLVAFGFHRLERHANCNPNLPNGTSFMTAIFFCGTVFTTIGYGNVYPCTDGAKILTIFFAITSIPIALITLDNIGFLLAKFFSWVWNKMRRCLKRIRERKLKIAPENVKADRDTTLPLSIGVFFLLLWISFMVVFFYILQKKWSVLDAVYFVFVTITTVGFGDLTPSDDMMKHWLIPKIFMIMVGLSLFSMCINLVMESMTQMVKDIAGSIIEDYFDSVNNDTGAFRETNPEKVRVKIKSIMAKHPGGFFLRFFILRHTMDDLIEQYMRKGTVKPAATQVEDVDWEMLKYTENMVDKYDAHDDVPKGMEDYFRKHGVDVDGDDKIPKASQPKAVDATNDTKADRKSQKSGTSRPVTGKKEESLKIESDFEPTKPESPKSRVEERLKSRKERREQTARSTSLGILRLKSSDSKR